MKALPSERGQAMVLIVFAIIGLFGMAALAIDMGQIYAARRNAQNAADAAALAAAYDASTGSKVVATAEQIGYDIAKINGFSNDQVTNWVKVKNDPVDGAYCGPCTGRTDSKDYYQVTITVRMQPIFAQLVFKGIEQVSVEAVAHATTADEASAGNALFALNPDAEDAINFDGNVSVDIKGGNVRSNGGMTRKGKPDKSTINVDSKTGGVYYADDFGGSDATFTDAMPVKQAAVNMGIIPSPACPTAAEAADWDIADGVRYKVDDNPAHFVGSDNEAVTTYYYENGLTVSDLPKGIHCVDGGIDKGTITGYDVLIVLMSGDLKMTGNDTYHLEAATDIKDLKGTQWGGMVFYVPTTNDLNKKNTITFGGNSGGYFYGVVYAPKGICDIGGNPDTESEHAAIICDKIKIHGTPSVNITYVPEELFHFPPRVELVQ